MTGASGFIGSHLVRRLTSLGAEVHAVSRSPRRDSSHFWHAADLRDADASAALVRLVRPDVVFHLAGEVTGARDVKLVMPTMHGNLASAVNVLTAVAASLATRVVLAGSIEEPRKADATPSSPYAAAKSAATSYAQLFHALWDVPVTALRIAMVYGPGQWDATKLVPYVIRCLLRGQQPLVGSGTRLVDWVYVDDVVDAFLAAATFPGAGRANGHAVDIGTGTGVSVRDFIELLTRLVGGSVRAQYGGIPDRPLEVVSIADPGPAANLLGWRPVTALEDGLQRTVRWYTEHPG